MSLVNWAKSELDRLMEVSDENDEMQKVMNENILELLEVFSKQGHTNFSANYLIAMVTRLMSYKPITPLTGEDDEWDDVSLLSDAEVGSLQQNKRYSAVFRENNDNSTAYWTSGKVFSDDGGETWFTNGNSRVDISFPYDVPDKPEYIILEKCEHGFGHECSECNSKNKLIN